MIVIGSAHCFSELVVCSGSYDVYHIDEEVLSSLGGQIRINVHRILYMYAFCKFSIWRSSHI
jgi:hypothetical protein